MNIGAINGIRSVLYISLVPVRSGTTSCSVGKDCMHTILQFSDSEVPVVGKNFVHTILQFSDSENISTVQGAVTVCSLPRYNFKADSMSAITESGDTGPKLGSVSTSSEHVLIG